LITLCGNYYDSSAVGSRNASVRVGLWWGSCDAINAGFGEATLTFINSAATTLTTGGTTCFTLAVAPDQDLDPCANFIVVGFRGNGGSFGTGQVTWSLRLG